ncbi:S8 family peptidase [Paenibacillus polymyxa]|uniref:S8 family peptidase n=1 Tax=Paenibacillus polymyxa TaxID=1406 RepID=UPI0003D364CE|nr:S8 family serine peptidase [Paenibacillus polymyxa]AHC22710.1 hypothetical protein X809_06585 [Paenibacillus polymyxa CR1]
MGNLTFILKSDIEHKDLIVDEINELGGYVEYSSPILPIIAFSGNEEMKDQIEKMFDLDYIMVAPEDGKLQEEGMLTANFSPLQIVPKIDASKTRNANCHGWGVEVAVLDSGMSESFIKEHHDFTGYGSTPAIHHGNKVANIIKRFARGSNIISCKVAHNPSGIKMIDVLRAVDFVMNSTNARIINMSLGFGEDIAEDKCPLCESVNAYSRMKDDVVFVVAAGNEGKEGTISRPGKAQEAVTVGAITDKGDAVARYSSKGLPNENKPNILTSGSIYYNQEYDDGTSYSTPIITGVIAALASNNSKPTLSKIKDTLYETADDIQAPRHHQGFGVMNLDRILEVLNYGESNSQVEG